MKVINNKKGFTLIELLVVVAIIGILSSVGVVAYNGYTAGAKESACKGNFRTIVKSVYENIMWCELNPTINFLWNTTQSLEYDCNNMFVGGRDTVYTEYTKNEKIARLTIDQIAIHDLSLPGDIARGKKTKSGSRSTLTSMTNPYAGKTGYGVFNVSGTRELYEGDEYDLRGQVTLRKQDSSGNEIAANEEGQLFLITKCGDKVIEHDFDFY
ncbi:Fimbrial protein pilin [Candidatus Pelagibacter ubique HTCC1002]|uniref:Fimbrial protein pilin n=1 Tax=Pelagibacter ubique (strain HTCC1002) TaxID=314261 RepID=Q1UZV3_PELU1|nr:prepilin-type N-terminal cleavage/methylation domain-containing protein [Candidatus Pelagibacter ubique]EAS84088.1 Fimbrial protein pilin [Candidatus Pelagibacter ubique HTCC1002]